MHHDNIPGNTTTNSAPKYTIITIYLWAASVLSVSVAGIFAYEMFSPVPQDAVWGGAVQAVAALVYFYAGALLSLVNTAIITIVLLKHKATGTRKKSAITLLVFSLIWVFIGFIIPIIGSIVSLFI